MNYILSTLLSSFLSELVVQLDSMDISIRLSVVHRSFLLFPTILM